MIDDNVKALLTFPLPSGEQFFIDGEDASVVGKYRWKLNNGYVCRNIATHKEGKRWKYKCLILSREIMDAPCGMVVDHVNGNPLDNRRSNLRICTVAQNGANKKTPINNRSGRMGVHLEKKYGRWHAIIGVGGRSLFLGSFANKGEAIIARELGEKKYFGEFAYDRSTR